MPTPSADLAFGREPGDLGDEGVAQVADALAGELRGRVAGVEELVGGGHHFGGVVGVDGFEDALEDGVGDGAHQLANLGGVEAGVAGVPSAEAPWARRRWPGP